LQGHQLRQRDYLLQISRAMTSRLDLPSLLELTLKSAVELLRGQVGLIVLRGRDGALHVRASYGLPSALLRFFQPLWADLSGPLSRLRMADLQMRLDVVGEAAGLTLSQVVALPLEIEDRLMGAIYILRTSGGAFRRATGRCWLLLPISRPSPSAMPTFTSR
jgi:hypothetical protein